MEKEYLYQTSIISWIKESLSSEIMIPVSGKRVSNGYDVFIQSYMLPESEIDNEMTNDTYNAHSLFPCVVSGVNWKSGEYDYSRFGNYNDYEPLVIKRDFGGIAPDSIEIAEEFRLLFNLYYNEVQKEYIYPADGACITVIKMDNAGFITIHKKYLKTYLTLKKKVLLIHVDSRCTNIDNSSPIKNETIKYKTDDNSLLYTLSILSGCGLTGRENYSIVYAKKLLEVAVCLVVISGHLTKKRIMLTLSLVLMMMGKKYLILVIQIN